jgi:hypothetical protein
MTSMAINLEYRRPDTHQSPHPQTQSAFGIASLIFAGLTAVTFYAACDAAVTVTQRPSVYYEWIGYHIFSGLTFLGAGTGVVLAVAGLWHRHRKRGATYLGFSLNGFFLTAMTVIALLIRAGR